MKGGVKFGPFPATLRVSAPLTTSNQPAHGAEGAWKGDTKGQAPCAMHELYLASADRNDTDPRNAPVYISICAFG